MSEQVGTVFIVDDDASVSRAVARLLAAEGFKTLTFETAEEFLQYPMTDVPCCLVLDLQLPGLNGIELQEQLTSRRPRIPIVFISGHGDIPASVQAIKAGANDFLCKPVPAEALLSAVRQAILQHTESIRQETAIAAKRQEYESLTVRERQVLELVVQGRLNKQIAGILGITEATVKVHRGRVMQKLQAESVAELVRVHDRLRQDN
ncbi:MAG: response regulator [bacterium]|nr:response regulator [bacterium]